MKEEYDFIVGILDALAWPLVVFGALFMFRQDIKNILSRMLSGEVLGAKISLQSEKDYLEKIKKIESATTEEEKELIRRDLIEPEKESITPDKGAEFLAEDIIRRMPDEFTIVDVGKRFDELFSSNPEQVKREPVRYFKSMVMEKVRSNKMILEKEADGTLEYRKIVTLGTSSGA